MLQYFKVGGFVERVFFAKINRFNQVNRIFTGAVEQGKFVFLSVA